MPDSEYNVNKIESNKVRVDVVEQFTKEPEHRIALNQLEQKTQYHGLLVYTDGGDILVGWITAKTQ